MRIDFRRRRFIVSLSERDVLRLLSGGPLTSIEVFVDGLPADDHALMVRIEHDEVHYATPPDPLPVAEAALKSWLFSTVQQEAENPELWLTSPRLAFADDGQLLELSDHRSIYLSMERRTDDAVVFDLEKVQVHVTALCNKGEPRLVCWLGDEGGSWSDFRNLVLRGDEARALLRYQR